MSSARRDETLTDQIPTYKDDAPAPSLVRLWSAQQPTYQSTRLLSGELIIGREEGCDIKVPADDPAASRRHTSIAEAHGRIVVKDLGSKNGTHVNGHRITAAQSFALPCVVRVGGTVFLIDDGRRLPERHDFRIGDAIVGPAMRKIREEVADAARRERTLVIHGETGTGKERLASVFHAHGPNVRGQLVARNCARFDRDRAEAELFGAMKGAYTGADRTRAGCFEEADGGTLFLDEIGELTLDVQVKLLRALQDKIIQPLGGKPKHVNVAICAATHKDLRALVAQGLFREDLFHRLAQREVSLPPLRDRPEEIPFLVELIRESVPGAPPPSPRFIEACLLHRWPGNIRELETVVERFGAAAAGTEAIEPHATRGVDLGRSIPPTAPVAPPSGPPPLPPVATTPTTSAKTPRDMKDDVIAATVAAHGGDVTAAAKELKISPSTVYAALQRWRERG